MPLASSGSGSSANTGSAAYIDLYNRLINNMGVNDMTQGAGSWSNRQAGYTGGYSGDKEREEREHWTNRIRYQDQEREEGADYHEANDAESFMAGLQDFTSNFMENLTGFSHNRETYGLGDARTWASFVPNIFLSPMTAIGETVPFAYESATGRNVTKHYQDENGVYQIKDEELDPWQRFASGANAAIDLGGLGIGGKGDIAVAGLSAARNAFGRRAGREALSSYSQKLVDTAADAAKTGANAIPKSAEEARKLAEKTPFWRSGLLGSKKLGGSGYRTGGEAKAEHGVANAARVIGSDMLEEGSEEAIQSVLEDVRYDQLDAGSFGRAAEAAMWGAVGGGIMGGTSLGIQSAIETGQRKSDKAAAGTAAQETNRMSVFDRFESSRDQAQRDLNTRSFDEYAAKANQKGNENPGAVSVNVTTSTRPIRTWRSPNDPNRYITSTKSANDGELGALDIKDIYDSHPQQAAEFLAERFNTSVDNINNALGGRHVNGREIQNNLMELLYDAEAQGKPVYFAYGRNPKTSEYGGTNLRLSYITEGHGVSVEQLVHESFKDDGDGDLAMIAFGGDIYQRGLDYGTPMDQLTLKGSNVSNVEYKYYRFKPKSEARKDVENIIGELFPNVADYYNQDNLESLYDSVMKLYPKLANDGKRGYYGLGNKQDQAVTDFLQNLRETFREVGRNTDDRIPECRLSDALAKVFGDITETSWIDAEVQAVANGVAQQAKNINDAIPHRAIPRNEERSANFGSATHTAEITKLLGLNVGYVSIDKVNPVFRQMCEVIYGTMGQTLETVDGLLNGGTDVNTFEAIIIGLKNCGEHPEQIKSMFNAYVLVETMMRWDERNGASTPSQTLMLDFSDGSEQFEDFLKIFTDVHNRWVDRYKDAVKKITAPEETVTAIGESIPIKITPESKHEQYRAFVSIFENMVTGSVFKLSDENPFLDAPLGETIATIASHPGDLDYFRSESGLDEKGHYRKDLMNVMQAFCEDYQRRASATESSIREEAEQVLKILKAIRAEDVSGQWEPGYTDVDGNLTIDPAWENAFVFVMEWYTAQFGDQVFDNIPNFGSIKAWLNTEVGRRFFFAKSVDDVLNNMIEVAIAADFTYDLAAMEAASDLISIGVYNRALSLIDGVINDLYVKSWNSPLHAAIYDHAKEFYDKFTNATKDGAVVDQDAYEAISQMLSFVEKFIDPAISFADKEEFISTYLPTKNFGMNERANHPILVYALADGDSSINLSDLANRRRRTMKIDGFNGAYSYKTAVADSKVICDWIDKNKADEQHVVSTLKYLTTRACQKIPDRIAVQLLYDAADTVMADKEKGQATNSQSVFYQAREAIVNGSEMSDLSKLIVSPVGGVSLSTFRSNPTIVLKLLFEPGFSLTVIDDIDGRAPAPLTRDSVLRELGIEPKDTLSSLDYKKIFQTYPSVASLIGPREASTTLIGFDVRTTHKRPNSIQTTLQDTLRESQDSTAFANKMFHNVIQQQLDGEQFYWGLIWHAVPENFWSMTESEKYKALNSAKDKVTDFFVALSRLNEGSQFMSAINALASSSNAKLAKDTARMLDDASDLFSAIVESSGHIYGGDPSSYTDSDLNMAEVANSAFEAFFNNIMRGIQERTSGSAVSQAAAAQSVGAISQEQGRIVDNMVFDSMLQAFRSLQLSLVCMANEMNFSTKKTIFSFSENSSVYQQWQNMPNLSDEAANFLDTFTQSGGDLLTLLISSSWSDGSAPLAFVPNDILSTLDSNLKGILGEEFFSGHQLSLVAPLFLQSIQVRLDSLQNDPAEIDAFVRDLCDAATPILRGSSEDSLVNFDPATLEEDVRQRVTDYFNLRAIGSVDSWSNPVINWARRVNAQLGDHLTAIDNRNFVSDINTHGADEMMQYLAEIPGIARRCRGALERFCQENHETVPERIGRSDKDAAKVFCSFGFADSRTSFAAQNMITRIKAAGVENIISTNASDLAPMGLISLYNENASCAATPTDLPVRAVLRDLNLPDTKWMGCSFYVEDQYHDGVRMQLAYPENLTNLDPNQIIHIFSNDCNLGGCHKHVSRDTGAILTLARIIKVFKEDVALRRKKAMSADMPVVRESSRDGRIDLSNPNNTGYRTVSVTNPSAIPALIESVIEDYRQAYADYLSGVVQQFSLKSDVITDADLRSLANLLCSSVELSFDDDNSSYFVSREWLQTDHNFDNNGVSIPVSQYISERVSNAKSPELTIRVNFMSPEYLSNRIGDKIAFWQSRNRGVELQSEMLYTLASTALNDLSDLNTPSSRLNASDLIRSVDLVGTGVNDSLPMASTPRPAQQFVQDYSNYDMAMGRINQIRTKRMNPDYRSLVNDVNRQLDFSFWVQRVDSVTAIVEDRLTPIISAVDPTSSDSERSVHSTYAVTRVFSTDLNNPSRSSQKFDSHLELRQQLSFLTGRTGSDANADSVGEGSVLVLGDSVVDLNDAVSYAISHQKNYLIVPAYFCDPDTNISDLSPDAKKLIALYDMCSPDYRNANSNYTNPTVSTSLGDDFHLINVQDFLYRVNLGREAMRLDVTGMDPSAIAMSIVDEANHFAGIDSGTLTSLDYARRVYSKPQSQNLEVILSDLSFRKDWSRPPVPVNQQDIEALLTHKDEDDFMSMFDMYYWVDLPNAHYSRSALDMLRGSIVYYLETADSQAGSASSDKFDNSLRCISDVHANDCIGIYKFEDPGSKKTTYAPIFWATTSGDAQALNWSTPDNGNVLVCEYSQIVRPTIGDQIKTSIPTDAAKTLGTVVDWAMPTMASGYNSRVYEPWKVDQIHEGLSMSGRRFNKDEVDMGKRFFYDTHKNGGNLLLYVDEENGTQVLKPIKSIYDNFRGNEDTFWDLASGNESAWRRFAYGDFDIVSDPSLNQLYRIFATRCLSAIVNPGVFFCPTVITPSKTPGTQDLMCMTMDTEGNYIPMATPHYGYTQCARLTTEGLFSEMTMDMILRLYHHISLDCSYESSATTDPDNIRPVCRWCPNGTNDPEWINADDSVKRTYRYNHAGYSWYNLSTNYNSDDGDWFRVIMEPMVHPNADTLEHSFKNPSNYGLEQQLMDAFSLAAFPKDKSLRRFISRLMIRGGHLSGLYEETDTDSLRRHFADNPYGLPSAVDDSLSLNRIADHYSYLMSKYNAKSRDRVLSTLDHLPRIVGQDPEHRTAEEQLAVDSAIDALATSMGISKGVLNEADAIEIFVSYISCSEASEGGMNTTFSIDRFRHVLELAAKEFSDSKNLMCLEPRILTEAEDPGYERLVLPIFSPRLVDKIYANNRSRIDGMHGSKEDWIDAMFKKVADYERTVATEVRARDKRRALLYICDGYRLLYGKAVPVDHVFMDKSVENTVNELAFAARFASADPDLDPTSMKEAWNNAKKREAEYAKRNQALIESHQNCKTATTSATRSGTYTSFNVSSLLTHPFWNYVANARQAMGVMSPFVAVSSLVGREVCGGIVNYTLRHNTSGPGSWMYTPGITFSSKELPATVADDAMVQRIFRVIKAATYAGRLNEATECSSLEDIDALEKSLRTSSDSRIIRFLDGVNSFAFKVASFGEVGMNIQVRNFILEVSRFIGLDPDLNAIYGQKVPVNDSNGNVTEVTLLEARLAQDPVGTLLELASGPAKVVFNRAWNSSMRGDIAQQNCVSMIMTDLCTRMPLLRFLTVSLVSPYFNFATNMTGRCLSMVAPVSSLHYLATNFLAQTEYGQRLNIQDAQIKASLKEAIATDLCHFGVTIGIAILIGLSAMAGCFEPPEDDDKIINWEDWTLFGNRIGDMWFVGDMLSLCLPVACTVAAIAKDPFRYGRYAGAILTNGLARAAYNNPMFAIVDTVSDFMELMTGIVQNKPPEGFEDAAGGTPSPLFAAFQKLGAQSMNFVTSLALPQFARDLYTGFRQWEVSYKKTVERDNFGQPVIDPDTGEYSEVDATYGDAMLRYYSRNNPWMAFILDVVTGAGFGPGGYGWAQMPNVHYYEPIQQYSAEQYSIYNEDGSQKPDAECEAIALEVINTLNLCDDTEELWRSGFYIPLQTKLFIGQYIHDILDELQANYQALQADGAFDRNNYPTWDEGEETVNNLRKAYSAEYEMWESVFDKLWSDPMRRPMQTYSRIDSTYAVDYNGDLYATGMKRNVLTALPFQVAPGSTDYPGNTMGAEGDWATASVLDNSITTGQRGLIADDMHYQQRFSLSDFDNNGASLAEKYGINNVPTTNTKRSSGYGYSYSYGGSGGGGGGGYRPSIRSYSPSFSMGAPSTMNTNRYYGANFDYLRPAFETKGSREASRREDF